MSTQPPEDFDVITPADHEQAAEIYRFFYGVTPADLADAAAFHSPEGFAARQQPTVLLDTSAEVDAHGDIWGTQEFLQSLGLAPGLSEGSRAPLYSPPGGTAEEIVAGIEASGIQFADRQAVIDYLNQPVDETFDPDQDDYANDGHAFGLHVDGPAQTLTSDDVRRFFGLDSTTDVVDVGDGAFRFYARTPNGPEEIFPAEGIADAEPDPADEALDSIKALLGSGINLLDLDPADPLTRARIATCLLAGAMEREARWKHTAKTATAALSSLCQLVDGIADTPIPEAVSLPWALLAHGHIAAEEFVRITADALQDGVPPDAREIGRVEPFSDEDVAEFLDVLNLQDPLQATTYRMVSFLNSELGYAEALIAQQNTELSGTGQTVPPPGSSGPADDAGAPDSGGDAPAEAGADCGPAPATPSNGNREAEEASA